MSKRWLIYKVAAEQAFEQRNHAESVAAWLAALAEAEELNPDNPRLVFTLENLAKIYWLQGHYQDAAPICRRILKIYERALGAEHSDVGTAAANVAMIYHAWKKHSEAIPFYKLALAVKTKALGDAHAEVKSLTARYDSLLKEISLLTVPQPDRHKTLAELCFIPFSEEALADDSFAPQKSILNFERLMTLQTSLHENDTARTTGWKMAFDAAKFAEKNQQFMTAERLYQRALELCERRLGNDHVIVAHILMQFARCQVLQNKAAESDKLTSQGRAILETVAERMSAFL